MLDTAHVSAKKLALTVKMPGAFSEYISSKRYTTPGLVFRFYR